MESIITSAGVLGRADAAVIQNVSRPALGRAWISAKRAGDTDLRDEVEAAERQAEEEQCQADEERTVWLKRRQIGDPRSADAEREQHERPDAAERRANSGCRAGNQ